MDSAKYISADKLEKILGEYSKLLLEVGKLDRASVYEKAIDYISNLLPQESVVSVVKCKDCRHYDPNSMLCERLNKKNWPGWYCADGVPVELANKECSAQSINHGKRYKF